jgi:sialidase-1
MYRHFIAIILLFGCGSAAVGAAPLEITDLYEGERIPDINVATDGTVLAFARSGRIVRRSTDGGKTWSDPIEVGDGAGGSSIVDTTTGDALVMPGNKEYLWRSKDSGATWTREKVTVKPNALGHGKLDGAAAGTNCSESGLTLQAGDHAGRLLMPARVMAPYGSNDQEWWPYHYNTSIYSDDGGKTWQVSDPVQSGTGEGTLAELSNGDIYYNSRSHLAVDHRRRIAWSYDGGHMYVDWRVCDDLREVGEPSYYKYGTEPSYGCNAGLIRLPLETTNGKDVLVFSTPDDPGGDRVGMTVWASFDRGLTWPVKRMIYEGPSAYSSLAANKDGSIYLLFEKGEKKLYETVAFAKFDLAWLTEGHDLEDLLATEVTINRPRATR